MKKVLSLLLMCIMLWQLCPAALADEAIPARATTQFNLRKEAYTGADRVANVPQGATLTILSYEEDGAWCRVKYRNAEGYAKKASCLNGIESVRKNADSEIVLPEA